MKNIYDVWDRFENSSAVEMHLETAEFTLHLKKPGAGLESVCWEEKDAAVYKKNRSYEKSQKVAEAFPDSTRESETVCSGAAAVEVKAPLAGIFYRAASPEAQPFVKLGDHVKQGEVIGIIEAMKMMNEVTAPIDGVVEAILVKDNEMVEYDQSLVRLK